MPLVDKLERIGVLLQNGTLSQEEFHQAKEHLLQAATPKVQAPEDKAQAAAIARAHREYLMVRHHCMVRDHHMALIEPRVSRLVVLVIGLTAWLGLGALVVNGFRAVIPALAIIPIGTVFVGAILMLGAINSHAMKIVRLRRAKRKLSSVI